ncbi:MAG: TolC family protein [Chitinophagaceae bacterium]|nr:TolC family protein [Chitinophagaceae bacterium]
MKHKVTSLVAVLLLVLFSTRSAMAQETRTISLGEAINLSIENSKQLKLNQAKIDEAVAATKEAEERRLPDANVSASVLQLSHPNINLKTKPSGSGTSSSTPTVSSAAYGILNLSLPVYAGGRIRYGIESANYLQQAVKLDAENDKDAIALNAVNAYINLYKAAAAVQMVQENLEQSRQRVKELSNLEKNGLLARNDLLKAELQSSNIELSLLDAENNQKLANLNMNLMLGLPGKTVLLTDSASIKNNLSLLPVEQYEQLALQNRKDIQALNERTKAAATGVKAVKAETLPSVAVTGGYIAADIPNFITVTNAVNIGVGVQYNIGSLWKNKSKVLQAEARQKQLQASREILDDAITLQISQAYENVLSSEKRIEVYAKAVEQANENYRIVKNKYNNSLATTTELLEADVAQLQAKMNYSFAQADAYATYNKLLQASGLINNTTISK